MASAPRGPAGGVAAGLSDYDNVSMVMSTRTVSASQFKAQCLAMLDEVAATGEEITVTKRGRAVARVLAAREPQSLRGSVSFNVSDEDRSSHSTSSGTPPNGDRSRHARVALVDGRARAPLRAGASRDRRVLEHRRLDAQRLGGRDAFGSRAHHARPRCRPLGQAGACRHARRATPAKRGDRGCSRTIDAKSFPGDPIDRLIYATALAARARLVTRDTAIGAFDPELTIW